VACTPLKEPAPDTGDAGAQGGAELSGASFDPSTGYLFVNVNELGAEGRDDAPACRRT